MLRTYLRRSASASTRTPYGCQRKSSVTVVFAAAGRRGARVISTPATSASRVPEPDPNPAPEPAADLRRQVALSTCRSTVAVTAAHGVRIRGCWAGLTHAFANAKHVSISPAVDNAMATWQSALAGPSEVFCEPSAQAPCAGSAKHFKVATHNLYAMHGSLVSWLLLAHLQAHARKTA